MKFYFFALFFSLLAEAQYYRSEWFTVDNGLPQNTVKDIAKDKYGFIWILTNKGVVRYDGHEFLLSTNPEFSTDHFIEFAPLGNAIYSVDYYTNNYLKISQRKLETFKGPEVPVASYGPNDGKIYFFLNKNNDTNKLFPIADFQIIELGTERYFFGKNTIEYQKNKHAERTIIAANYNYRILKNVFIHRDTIYITDPRNRRTMMISKGKISYDAAPSLYNDPGTKIYWYQAKDQVFVINKGNIYLSRIKNGKPALHFLVHYKDIEKDYIGSVLYDEVNRKLYIGSLIKGLNIISLSNFYISRKNIPFTSEVCYPALPFSRNSVISQDGTEYFRDTVKVRYAQELLSDKRRLLYDSSENILYLEFGKLYRRLKKAGYRTQDSIIFKNGAGFADKINGLFMVNGIDAAQKSDLCIFKNDQFNSIKTSLRLPDGITSIAACGKDHIYVGCYDGLYLVSLSQNKIVKKLAGGIAVKNIIKSGSGHYWMTTYDNKGFYLLKNNIPVRMPEDENRDLASAHTFLEDGKGFLWISTNNGLFKIPEKTLLGYAENRNSPVHYYRYTKLNGLLNNEFNTAYPGANTLENGDFVFPSMEGFVFFNPGEVKSIYPRRDQLFIERAYNSKLRFRFKDRITLESNFKTLNICIDMPYFSDAENIHLQARLINSTREQWENIDRSRIYTLDNDSPGNYILEVRYLTSENTFAYKTVAIEITPLFYQTLWFKFFVLGSLIIIIILVVHIRTGFLRGRNTNLKNNLKHTGDELRVTRDKLKNESEYKEKIIQSISHDITTPLSFMSYLTNQLDKTEDADKQKELFEMLHKTSEQLFRFTSDLREYTKLYNIENISEEREYAVFDLAENKKMLFGEIARKRNTGIVNLCDQHIKTRISKVILSVIIHNLIDNAVKNTVNGEITINTHKHTETDCDVEIAIADTGSGMSDAQMLYYTQMYENQEEDKELPAFKNERLGLYLVIRLIKKIQAEIRFQNNLPTGTVVKIIIKNK